MSKIDFQNGLTIGLASKGFNNKKQIKCESKVDSVILPVTLDTVEVQINNRTVICDSSVTLEE